MNSASALSKIQTALAGDFKPSSDFDLNQSITQARAQNLRPAAVLVPLLNTQSGLQVLLTKRSSKLKHHPGQVSFPGGKHEQTDKNLQNTATREAQEEVGINPNHVTILGQLPNHHTVTSFLVTPFVGLIENDFTPVLDKNEVEEAFCVPFAFLADLRNYSIQYRYWRNERRSYYTIPYGPFYIWGATARMLFELAKALEK